MTVLTSRLVSAAWSFRIKGETTAELKYKIRTDGDRQSMVSVYNQSLAAGPEPVPLPYVHIGSGAYVLDVKIEPQAEHARGNYIASVSCGPLPPGSETEHGLPEQIDDPTKRKVVLWTERISETEIVEKDRDGNPIVNAAGQAFDTPLTRERWLTVVVAKKNFPTLDDIDQINLQYDQKVNGGSFRGYPAETVLFAGAETGPPQFENGIRFYEATMRFVVRPEGWGKEILNQGFKHFDRPKADASAKLVHAVDDYGQPVTEPVKLALDGTLLPKGQTGVFVGPFHIYETASLSDLIQDPV